MTQDTPIPPERWQWMSEIIADALHIQDAIARDAFLRERCGDDMDALLEANSLLAVESSAAALAHSLDAPALADAAASLFSEESASERETASTRIGQRLGAYEIVDVVAVGGMGAVYKAKRVDESYETFVAIKVMRADLSVRAAQGVVARLRVERQLLANLNHPHITRMFDGGSTPEGFPYFVMEYVDGEPIDRYCDARALPIAERLMKFHDILSAVQYAHQRLIVHRDLKPSNILVDRNGTVKLLDFGIARLLNPEAEAAEADSRAALTTMLALTPAYASPEQVKSEAITTASDIYSLGVILYRLLAGVSPYKSKLTQPLALAREIVEAEPTRPSATVATVAQHSIENEHVVSDVAPRSEVDIARLRKALRGDLDNIVLMALRKDPALRYASAEQFSEDIRRYLAHEPVLAHADSLAYRAKKFVRRNRWSVVFAAIAGIGLVAGIAATTYQASIARVAQRQAEAERRRAEGHFSSVRSVVNDVLFSAHDKLSKVQGTVAVRAQLLDSATRYLDALANDPRATENASLLNEAGSGWLRLANIHGQAVSGSTVNIEAARTSYTRAVEYLQRARQLDQSNPEVGANLVRALHLFGRFASNQADLERGKTLLTQAVQVGLHESDKPSASRRLRQETAAALTDHVFYARGNAAADYARYRDYGLRARTMLEDMLATSTTDKERTETEDFLGYFYGTLAQLANTRDDGSIDNAKALEWTSTSLTLAKKAYAANEGDLHALVRLATAHADLAAIAHEAKDYPQAIAHRMEEVKLRELQAQADRDDRGVQVGILLSVAGLAEVYHEAGDSAAAEASVEKGYKTWRVMTAEARSTLDAITAKMALDALRARISGAKADTAALPAQQKRAYCDAAVAAYNDALQGRPRWEAFYRKSMEEEFSSIRSAMRACKGVAKDFPVR